MQSQIEKSNRQPDYLEEGAMLHRFASDV